MWRDVDDVAGASSAVAAPATAGGTVSPDDDFSVADLASVAAAEAHTTHHNTITPARPPGASPSSSVMPSSRDPRDIYISDELMYQMYDGDGTGHGKIRPRRRRHPNRMGTNLDEMRSQHAGHGGAGGGGDNHSSDDVDDNEEAQASATSRNIVLRYLSCLWPPETEEETARLDQSAWGQKNRFLRLLLKENWTDGSLVSLKTDVFSGVTLAVAQVAPSVAFALMAGGPPLVGLFSSFWLGIIPCVFGGRPGQITAIAGAVVVLYPDLVREHGVDAAYAVSLIAGCFILLPGIFRVAGLVRLLPASLMVGFCNGLGISMVMHQIPSFKDEQGEYVTGLRAFYTAIICVISYAVMMLMPYFTTIVPSAFISIVVGTAIQYIFKLKTVTIGDLYDLRGSFPTPMVPNIEWTDSSVLSPVMVAAVLTAIISCVESFMSDYKIQQLTETPTNFEREAISLGVAHIVNGFFQGMAGCVVFGPCILNIECGSGTRRLSSFICAVLMVIIPVALFAVIRIIPMAALSAVLFGVSSKTADWRMLAMILLQRISFQESVVALIVTIVTVIENLAIGAASGLAAAIVFFMWNMSRGKIYITPVLSSSPPSASPPSPTRAVVPGGARGGDSGEPSRRASALSRCAGVARPTNVGEDAGEDEEKECQGERGVASRTGIAPSSLAASFALQTAVPSPTQRFMEVNLLNVEVDPVFSDIKVLRIHLRGVLFFGSCMEFVDSMIRLLRDCHEYIFLKVTDLILDFQHGRMPVMDFSAAEAIFDAANTLARRGIRTHVQNMDPMSYALFERCRRYFPLVLDDNVNNCKHQCILRRVFKVQSAQEMSPTIPVVEDGGDNEGATSVAPPRTERDHPPEDGQNGLEEGVLRAGATASRIGAGDYLNDDVFVRANRSFTEVIIPLHGHAHAHHHHHCCDDERGTHHSDTVAKPPYSEDLVNDRDVEPGVVTNATTELFSHREAMSDSGASRDHDEHHDADVQRRMRQQQDNARQREGDAHVDEPTATPDLVHIVLDAPKMNTDARTPAQTGRNSVSDNSHSSATCSSGCEVSARVGVRLVATEEQPPLEVSIKVGFPIFRPHFGITVPVFATIDSWIAQLTAEEKQFVEREEDQRQQRESGKPHQAGVNSDMLDDVIHELDRGIDAARKPLNRQYGDFLFTKVWWRRLFKLDIPPVANVADEAQLAGTRQKNADVMRAVHKANIAAIRVKDQQAQEARAETHAAAFRLRARTAPTHFTQVPRFPGQGYAKDERLTRAEVARMKKIIYHRLFQQEAPREIACFPARMKKFEVDLMDGFI